MRHLLKLLAAVLTFVVFSACARAENAIPSVSRVEAVALVRTTLARLNDANQTANYEILRDLSAPAFQLRFKIDDLNRLFAGLRDIDLTLALTNDPVVEAAQYLSSQKLLRLSGQLATSPNLVRFQLTFQVFGNQWKIYGVALDFVRPHSTRGNA